VEFRRRFHEWQKEYPKGQKIQMRAGSDTLAATLAVIALQISSLNHSRTRIQHIERKKVMIFLKII